MCIVHHNGIYIGNIYTTFNNISTNQYIVFFIDEVEDAFFQFMTFHLSMCKSNAEIGTQTLNDGGHFCQPCNSVVNKEHLAATFGFKINSIPNKIFLEHLYFRLYWLAIRWRSIHDAEISCTHQTKLQRAWYRRCRKS